MASYSVSDNAKMLLLTNFLAKDTVISMNGACFLKELILRRDPRVKVLLGRFESEGAEDSQFLDQINDLIEEESFALYNECFSNCTLEMGKSLSREERDQKNLEDEKNLIYGEVDFHSFYRCLRKINPTRGGTFYDLGSGTGKAVLAARFTRDFSRCIGIEVLHGLHVAGVAVLERFNKEFRRYLNSSQSQQVSVYEGSFLEYDWSDGDLVFANSTCFDDEMMEAISEQAEALKPGAIFVTFTKGLKSEAFETLERKRYKMSWGPATVVIQRRLNHDGTPIGPAILNALPSDDLDHYQEDDNAGTPKSAVGGRRAVEEVEEDDDDDYESDASEDSENDDETVETDDSVLMITGKAMKLNRAEANPFRYEDLHETMSPDKGVSSPSRTKGSPSRLDVANSPLSRYDDVLNSPQDSALLQRKRTAMTNSRTFFGQRS